MSILTAILLYVGLAASAPRALAGHPAGFIIAFACLRGLQLLLYPRAWRHLPPTRPPRPQAAVGLLPRLLRRRWRAVARLPPSRRLRPLCVLGERHCSSTLSAPWPC